MHCSDADLVALRDGELAFPQSWRVKRHLNTCWQCRARASSLESRILSLSSAMEQWSFPGPRWRVDAKTRLQSGMKEVEYGLTVPPPTKLQFRRHRWALASAAAIAAVFVLATFVVRRPNAKLDAPATLARISAAEDRMTREPLEQEFDVRLEEIKPSRTLRTNGLRVLSDSAGRRFMSKWTDGRGTLQHAVWQPSATAEHVLNASVLTTRVPAAGSSGSVIQMADGGLDVQQLESAFLRWLDDRRWRPVSFASDLSSWSKEDGTLMTAERVTQNDGTTVIRISARRHSRSLTALMTVDVDSTDYRPRLQTIEFQTAEHVVRLQLATKRFRPVSPSEIPEASFHPDAAFLVNVRTSPAAVVEPPRTAPEIAIPGTIQAVPNLNELRAIEAQYVLHLVHTCLEEPVKILEENGRVRVRSRSSRASNERDLVTTWATLHDVLDALADFRNRTLVPADAPQLTRANRTSSTVLQHAAALVMLADRFPLGRTQSFPPEAWRLFQIIVSDHTAAIQREITSLNLPYVKSEHRAYAPRGWRESASTLNDKLRLLDELVADDRADEAAALGPEIEGELAVLASDFAAELNASGHGTYHQTTRYGGSFTRSPSPRTPE